MFDELTFFKVKLIKTYQTKTQDRKIAAIKINVFSYVPIFNFFATLVIEAWAIILVYVVDILNNKTISKRELDLLGKVGSGIIF